MTAEVLVTGASGFIGRHVAQACRDAGWAVTALDRRARRPPLEQVRSVVGDAGDGDVIDAIRGGRYVAVVHQAGLADTMSVDAARLASDNVLVPWRLAQACELGGSMFVYASSGSVYGRISQRRAVTEAASGDRAVCSGPLNLYAMSKLMLDDAMGQRRGGLRWVGLRYTNVFGPGESHKGPMASMVSQITRRAASGQPVELFDDTLDACRDYVPVSSVAEAVVRLLHRPVPSAVYNLGSGHVVSFRTLLEWCSDFRGASVEVRAIPNPISGRYQHWTCADVTALQNVLPGLPGIALDDIKAAARSLYRHHATNDPRNPPVNRKVRR